MKNYIIKKQKITEGVHLISERNVSTVNYYYCHGHDKWYALKFGGCLAG